MSRYGTPPPSPDDGSDILGMTPSPELEKWLLERLKLGQSLQTAEPHVITSGSGAGAAWGLADAFRTMRGALAERNAGQGLQQIGQQRAAARQRLFDMLSQGDDGTPAGQAQSAARLRRGMGLAALSGDSGMEKFAEESMKQQQLDRENAQLALQAKHQSDLLALDRRKQGATETQQAFERGHTLRTEQEWVTTALPDQGGFLQQSKHTGETWFFQPGHAPVKVAEGHAPGTGPGEPGQPPPGMPPPGPQAGLGVQQPSGAGNLPPQQSAPPGPPSGGPGGASPPTVTGALQGPPGPLGVSPQLPRGAGAPGPAGGAGGGPPGVAAPPGGPAPGAAPGGLPPAQYNPFIKLNGDQAQADLRVSSAINGLRDALRVGFPSNSKLGGTIEAARWRAAEHGMSPLANPDQQARVGAWDAVVDPMIRARAGARVPEGQMSRMRLELRPNPGESWDVHLAKVHRAIDTARAEALQLPPIKSQAYLQQLEGIEQSLPRTKAEYDDFNRRMGSASRSFREGGAPRDDVLPVGTTPPPASPGGPINPLRTGPRGKTFEEKLREVYQ